MKSLEENRKGSSMAQVLAVVFLHVTSKAQATEATMNKQDYVQLSFCTAKKQLTRGKAEQASEGHQPEYVGNEHIHSKTKIKSEQPNHKRGKYLNRCFSKKTNIQ